MSVSSEFVLRPILTTAASQGNEGQSQPSKTEEEEEDQDCATPKGQDSRIMANSALPARCPDPPRKRRCVVIGKRTNPQIGLIAVDKEEMDRLFVRRDRLPVGCAGAGAMSVKLGSKRKRRSVSDEC